MSLLRFLPLIFPVLCFVLFMYTYMRSRKDDALIRERECYDLDCMRHINSLRAREGWSVTLICDNPEGDDVVIEVFGEWKHMGTGDVRWITKPFRGVLLLEALACADYRARDEVTK